MRIPAVSKAVPILGKVGEAPAMARASFFLLLTGGALGLVSTLFVSEQPRNTGAVVVTAIAALLLSLVPALRFDRLTSRTYELLCAAGTLLVSSAICFGGTSAYEFFYFWVAFYAAYFFTARRLALQLVFMIVLFPVAERVGQGSAPTVIRWILGATTLVVAAGMIFILRRNSQSALARLEALFEASPLAIFELDGEGRVARWNEMAAEVFGWESDEVVGRRLPVLVERSERRPLADHLLTTPPRTDFEIACLRRDETRFEAAVFSAPSKAAGEDASRLVLVADMSKPKELERRLAHGSKMEAVGRLAGGIAHDFNNLLLIIRSHSWLLRERLGGSDELVAIENAADDAGRIVQQLLNFGRTEPLEPRAIDLNELLKEVESLLAPVLGEDIEFVRAAGDSAATVLADPTQLELVLVNLILNARDALQGGGTLEIAAEPALRHGTRWTRIRVSDNGVGMDAGTQARMFDPFFTTKERGRGTGLGLAVAYELVEQNGGEIDIWSSEGKGTTVSVYLPFLNARPTHSPPALVGPSEFDDQTGMETVLVVDDEPDVRESLRRSLERYGYRVFTASQCERALDLAEELKGELDVVVTDVVMPAMSGFELGRRLAAISPNLPVVYISGYPDEAILEAPLPAPAFIPKPFTPPLLARTIRETIGSAKA
jgi:two-component system, cell cycle sensor histidine kinase and response regulator CckA